jgi:hypothetical protein
MKKETQQLFIGAVGCFYSDFVLKPLVELVVFTHNMFFFSFFHTDVFVSIIVAI